MSPRWLTALSSTDPGVPPLVLDLGDPPRFDDAVHAIRWLHLAVLAACVHPEIPPAVHIMLTALDAMDEEDRYNYADVVLAALSGAARGEREDLVKSPDTSATTPTATSRKARPTRC